VLGRGVVGVLGGMRFGRVVLAGAVCWVLAAPVLVVAEVVVGLGWAAPGYSWSSYNISDLGNVTCGVWDTSRPRYVCSPWYEVMNVALVVASVLVASGLFLAGRGLGLGVGSMERLAVYPLWVWACVAGVRLWVLSRWGVRPVAVRG
jgi:hypothetical membrane protein